MNNYFQFKQFYIYQDKCAMKVSTDACVFGAVVAEKIIRLPIPINNILDIGAGTGLLSLMMAQKCKANIDAIEIEEAAANQAAENFFQSSWNKRLHCFYGDVRNYSFSEKYDFIIVNPPFFENSLKNNDPKKMIARHDDSLNSNEILSSIKKLLSPEKYFAILLPFDRFQNFKKLAISFQFYLQQTLLIRQTPEHPYFRQIGIFCDNPSEIIKEEIIIQNAEGNYAPEFIALLKDYYLYL